MISNRIGGLWNKEKETRCFRKDLKLSGSWVGILFPSFSRMKQKKSLNFSVKLGWTLNSLSQKHVTTNDMALSH